MRPDNSISVEPLRNESFLLLLIAPDDESVDAQRDAVLRGIAEFLPALVKQTPVRVFTVSKGVSPVQQRLRYWLDQFS
jgi:hypothetical protein